MNVGRKTERAILRELISQLRGVNEGEHDIHIEHETSQFIYDFKASIKVWFDGMMTGDGYYEERKWEGNTYYQILDCELMAYNKNDEETLNVTIDADEIESYIVASI